MNIAIMQPYLFPYLGYFKLINAVDKFVFLDNVQFVKRGWMNRNYLRSNDRLILFTLPKAKSSRDTLIKDVIVDKSNRNKFYAKLRMSLRHYGQPERLNRLSDMLDSVCEIDTDRLSKITQLSVSSIASIFNLTNREFLIASELMPKYQEKRQSAQQRIINLCKECGATEYTNFVGGMHLYNVHDFHRNGIKLRFIDVSLSDQFLFSGKPLSVLDTLLSFEHSEIIEELNKYKYCEV